MSDQVTSSLFFSDGCMIGPETFVATGHFNAYPDADLTRIVFRFESDLVVSDSRSDMLRSVTYSVTQRKCYIAGRNGLIQVYGTSGNPFTLDNVRGTLSEETIDDITRYGELFRIRAIGDQVYCCGQSSQVYVRGIQGWVHADDGILSKRAETLEDIHGTAPDNIYAVGMSGTILHFNGTRWNKLDSPTNQHLSSVRCVSKDLIYISGNNGTLLRGNVHGWETISSNEFKMNFWDIEIVGEQVYLAHVRGLVLYNGSGFSNVPISKSHTISCYRLSSLGNRILSTGPDNIFLFDGESWTEFIWPDNRK